MLLVEDSREVAEVTSTLFEQLGYRVVRAENAAEALRHLQQGVQVDLLFSDIVMPGPMNGFALAEACRERFPRYSGAADQGLQRRGAGRRRPFRYPAQAVRIVRARARDREAGEWRSGAESAAHGRGEPAY